MIQWVKVSYGGSGKAQVSSGCKSKQQRKDAVHHSFINCRLVRLSNLVKS